ncbi:sugar phosphate nucleotidyltransferase [Sporocytophaga myxococcoides]|uniref:sugar phosphate nucleotidyltransferase n=1 Tax=Sporocytophaga myxococcoides TaxID=153721 RepID=UPI000403FDBC|nr:sugar phosphate nucleotidyltransferase [Sporocytophaga myxococcoides]
MQQNKTIILCGGSIDFLNLPINTNQSHAMIPVNGKPVIGWILDDLLSEGINEVIITRKATDFQLCDFLINSYRKRMKITQVPLLFNGNILDSLRAGLDLAATDGEVKVILGDTLIYDSYKEKGDYVYVHEVKESHRWCLASIDKEGKIIDYIDKKEDVPAPNFALCGYYNFQSGQYLRKVLVKALSDGKKQLSDVLRLYGEKHSLQAIKAKHWYDFGNIDNLVSSRQRLLQGRFFNSLTIDGVLNTITKNSTYNEKLRDELNWYFQIPDELKVLTPRIINHSHTDETIKIVQEYYGYSTLSELFLYADIHIETWRSILNKLFSIHGKFREYKGELNRSDVSKIYKGKTLERLDTQKALNSYWNNLLSKEFIVWNGKKLINAFELIATLSDAIEELIDHANITVIHGDYCFSNILFDINTQITRLIDPRGSFGKKGIFGDSRYDIAKLRHSICGLYDYIVSDLFTVQEVSEGVFETAILASETSLRLENIFDKLIVENGYKLEDIKLIEGLLFISMLPLHKDKPERQKLMYLRGLALLNEVATLKKETKISAL